MKKNPMEVHVKKLKGNPGVRAFETGSISVYPQGLNYALDRFYDPLKKRERNIQPLRFSFAKDMKALKHDEGKVFHIKSNVKKNY